MIYIDSYFKRTGVTEQNPSGACKLEKIVKKILRSEFPFVPESEYNDFYSIAELVILDCAKKYNPEENAKFETYFINCLKNKIKTRITRMNRKKRNNGQPVLSIEKCIDEEEKMSLKDTIIAEEKDDICSLTQRYLDLLTKTQKKIAELIMDGYDLKTIKQILNLTDKKFNVIYQQMNTGEKKELLDKLKEKMRGESK